MAIKSGTFRFAKVFPESKKAEYFSKKERALSGGKKPSEEILVRDHIWVWYNLHKGSGRLTGRTYLGKIATQKG